MIFSVVHSVPEGYICPYVIQFNSFTVFELLCLCTQSFRLITLYILPPKKLKGRKETMLLNIFGLFIMHILQLRNRLHTKGYMVSIYSKALAQSKIIS